MKQIVIWMISVICVVVITSAFADDGGAIFKSLGCMICHKQESKSKVNPSLIEISQAYQGKEEQLLKYLKGESDAIVKPDKANLMRRYIEKTKKLPDADLKSLADYLMHQQ